MEKKYIVIIYQDDVPEYTIDEQFVDEEKAKQAGEEALEEIRNEIKDKKDKGLSYDTGVFSYQIVELDQ